MGKLTKMIRKFEVEFLQEAKEFLDNLEEKAREKILFNIRKAQIANDKELFKKLTSDIWEFSTYYNKFHYRLFAFWVKSNKTITVVIATHGIVKKSDKTPKTDIEKAEMIRKMYLE